MSKITENFYSIIGTSTNEQQEQQFETIKNWMKKEQYEEAIEKLIEILNEDPMNIDASILLLVCKIDITADSSVYKNLYENNSEEFIEYIKQLILLYEKIKMNDKEQKYQEELKDYLLFVENMKGILENKLKYVETINKNKELLKDCVKGRKYPLVFNQDKKKMAEKYFIDKADILVDFDHILDIKADMSYGEQTIYGISFEEIAPFLKNANKKLQEKYRLLSIRRIMLVIVLFLLLVLLCFCF